MMTVPTFTTAMATIAASSSDANKMRLRMNPPFRSGLLLRRSDGSEGMTRERNNARLYGSLWPLFSFVAGP
jgi:hypothetical protein